MDGRKHRGEFLAATGASDLFPTQPVKTDAPNGIRKTTEWIGVEPVKDPKRKPRIDGMPAVISTQELPRM